MLVAIIIVCVILMLLLVSFLVMYQKIEKMGDQVKNSFLQYESAVKKKTEALSNVVTEAKKKRKKEEVTFDLVLDSIKKIEQIEKKDEFLKEWQNLKNLLIRFYALLEAYKELKEDEEFSFFMKEQKDLDEKVNLAKIHYNKIAQSYNKKLETFPNSLIASLTHLKKELILEE